MNAQYQTQLDVFTQFFLSKINENIMKIATKFSNESNAQDNNPNEAIQSKTANILLANVFTSDSHNNDTDNLLIDNNKKSFSALLKSGSKQQQPLPLSSTALIPLEPAQTSNNLVTAATSLTTSIINSTKNAKFDLNESLHSSTDTNNAHQNNVSANDQNVIESQKQNDEQVNWIQNAKHTDNSKAFKCNLDSENRKRKKGMANSSNKRRNIEQTTLSIPRITSADNLNHLITNNNENDDDTDDGDDVDSNGQFDGDSEQIESDSEDSAMADDDNCDVQSNYSGDRSVDQISNVSKTGGEKNIPDPGENDTSFDSVSTMPMLLQENQRKMLLSQSFSNIDNTGLNLTTKDKTSMV